MIPTLSFITENFITFNQQIFGCKLPTPKFRLTKARTFRGKMCWTNTMTWKGARPVNFEMRISTSFDLPVNEWEDVIIHEMIHLHIAVNRLQDTSSHGSVFRKIMNAINRSHNRNIVVSSKSDSSQDTDKRIRAHYVCLAKFSDGRLGVAPVAKSRVFLLWDKIPAIPGVVNVSWIGTTDIWFNRLPRVMVPKVYIMDREETRLHLKGAVPLTKERNVIKVVSRRCSPDELLP